MVHGEEPGDSVFVPDESRILVESRTKNLTCWDDICIYLLFVRLSVSKIRKRMRKEATSKEGQKCIFRLTRFSFFYSNFYQHKGVHEVPIPETVMYTGSLACDDCIEIKTKHTQQIFDKAKQ